jgi:hypothetical protein
MTDQPKPPAEEAAPQPAPRRKRRLRKLLLVLLILLLLIGGLVAAGPMLLSTGPGKRMALRVVNGEIPGRVELDGLTLAWQSGQQLTGLSLRDPQDRVVLQAKTISMQGSLWSLLGSQPLPLGEIRLVRPIITLYQQPGRESYSISDALPPSKKSSSPSKPTKIDASILLEGGEIRLVNLDGQTLRVTQLQGQAKLTGDNLTAQLNALLDQAGPIELNISASDIAEKQPGPMTITLNTPSDLSLAPFQPWAMPTGQLAGRVNLTSEITRAEGAMNIRATLQARRFIAAQAGEPARPMDFDAVLNVTGLRTGSAMTLESMTLTSGDFLSARATQLRLSPTGGAGGDFQLRADLARLLAVLRPLLGEGSADIRGQLALSGRASSQGDVGTFTVQGAIDELSVPGSEGRPLRYGRVTLDVGGQIDQAAQTLQFERFTLRSDPLALGMAKGSGITQLSTEQILDIRGTFAGRWDRLMPLLYQLAPSLKTDVGMEFRGSVQPSQTRRGRFTLTGPARQPTIRPEFIGVEGNTAVGWSSGTLLGLALGEAVIQPALEKGKLHLRAKPIPASSGVLRPGGWVDLTGEEAVYQLPGRVRLIDRVRINPEVGRLLLGRINPMFEKLAELEGELTLVTQDLYLPLGESIKTRGRGRGRLNIADLRIRPRSSSSLAGKLLPLLGIGSTRQERNSIVRVDFELRDGRVYYDRFDVRVAEDLSLRFRGSVGFDGSLDLVVSVPIGEPLLRQFGVSGPIRDYARLAQRSGLRLDLPITGTNKSPRLRLDNRALEPILKRLGQEFLQNQAQQLLPQLLPHLISPKR